MVKAMVDLEVDGGVLHGAGVVVCALRYSGTVAVGKSRSKIGVRAVVGPEAKGR